MRFFQFFILFSFSFVLTSTTYAAINAEGIQTYQTQPHLTPEHKQKLAEDIDRYQNADDLWAELRHDFRLNHYEEDPLVQEQITWFMNHQDFLYRATSRAAPYLYYILQQAHLRHLPAEVVLLPIFESAYNPYAYSPQGASGIWQMMPRTASGYGIKQDWWYDGRRDVIASTKAALNYLSYLKNFFDGNWILAIAAYDSGEGTVQNAVHRNVIGGFSTDFHSLPLPPETRIYVPRLFALASIIANPDRYPVNLPPIRNAPYLAQLDINGQVDLRRAAGLAGLNFKDLIALNPGFNRTSTSPRGAYKLVLPIVNVEQFSENFANLPTLDQDTWQRHLVHHGETLLSLAVRYRTTPSILRKMNHMANNTLRPGKDILVPHAIPSISQTLLDEEKDHLLAENNSPPAPKKSFFRAALHVFDRKPQGHYVIQPGDTIYMTREGDTYDHIAKHFHLNTRELLAVNPHNPHLLPGEKLVIPTHQAKSQFAEIKSGTNYQLSPGDTIYMVRHGDTVEKIAAKFHTSAPAIRVTNLLASDKLNEGDHLVIQREVKA